MRRVHPGFCASGTDERVIQGSTARQKSHPVRILDLAGSVALRWFFTHADDGTRQSVAW